MLGFIIGTACLIGLIKTVRRGRCHGALGCGHGYDDGYGGGDFGGHGCGGHRHGGWGGPRGHHHHRGPWGQRGGWGEGADGRGAGRWMLRPLFERLNTTPGQERVILEAFEALRAQRQAVRDAMQATGADAAKAFRGESLDEAHMGEAFAKQNEALESTQKALFDALHKVHEALDPDQRRELADWMERGAGFFRRWGQGPYRA